MATQVYFIRHGIAAESNQYEYDRDRPLTPKGQAKTKAVAQRLKALGLTFDEILTSPLLRARQTAEILLQIDLAPHLRVTETLAPGGAFSDWLTSLNQEQPNHPRALVLVGHEPDLSQWAELLMFGDVQGILQLKKAGIIGLNIPDAVDPIGNSVLFWLTSPKFLLVP